jgi:hypothetical protein
MKLVDTAINTAQANIQRTLTHSGVVDYKSTINTNGSTTLGDISVFTTGTWLNRFKLGKTNSFLNGFKALIQDTNNSDSGIFVDLPAPPTFGTRDDLVFLEGYFPANGNGVDMSWRIRTVAWVDFGTYQDGMTLTNGGAIGKFYVVTAQGGNASPIATNDTNIVWSYFRSASVALGLTDSGLYVCGDGSSSAKTTLNTLDGYSYAIPLFRIKRRNSGGWNKNTNLSGARDYAQYFGLGGQANLTTQDIQNNGKTLAQVQSDFVGKTVDLNGAYGDGSPYTVISAATSSQGSQYTTLTFDRAVKTAFTTSTTVTVKSDRPDSLYSNIIDASDIIDLRHLARSSYNLQSLLEETLDKAERGELTTKDTKTAYKEHYNLQKAPLGLAQDLQSVNVKRADGTVVALKNLLGMIGNCEDASKFSTAGVTVALDSNIKKYGNNSIASTSTVSATSVQTRFPVISIDPSKYYIVVADIYNSNMTSTFLKALSGDGATTFKTESAITTTGSWVTHYIKLAPSDLTGQTSIRLDSDGVVSAVGQKMNTDGARIYEIDSTTYNLIDVDANWTGGDKISILFPYVDSPVNFVENLVPDFASGQWTLGAGASIDSPYKLKHAGGYTSSVTIPVVASAKYTVSRDTDLASGSNAKLVLTWLDSSGATISTEANYWGNDVSGKTFTAPANATKLKIEWTTINSGTYTLSNLQIEQTSTANTFVPFGRYYIPYDYAVGTSKNYITESFNSHRQTFSDAQISETVTDRVEALMTPQKHVTVTQATAGTWAVNDTIKFTSYNGVISGVIDSDTQFATISVGNSDSTLVVSDVSKLSVNDVVNVILNDLSVGWSSLTVTAIDTTNSKITLSGSNNFNVSKIVGGFVVETTTSSSLPTVTATGIVGTWSGLGTKTATYTITTPPTSNQSDILFKYSVNYPFGKGLANLPVNVDLVEVNGQRHVSGQTVSVKANFDGKTAGSTDLIPHTAKFNNNSTSLVSPSGSWTEFGSGYSTISALDSSTTNIASTLVSGNYGQVLFSFDLIRAIEDKFGETAFVGCLTTADKVAWLKNSANVSDISISWYGYGSAPSGGSLTNKAYLKSWANDTTNWNGSATHNSASVTSLTMSGANYYGGASFANRMIDTNGMIFFLAYADPSDGVTASTLFTDYVELSVTLATAETGYTVFQPEQQMPVLSENMLTANQAFPVDVSGFSVIGSSVLSIDSLGVLKADASAKGGADGSRWGLTLDNSTGKASYHTFSGEFKGVAGKSYRIFFYDGTTITYLISTLTATGNWQTINASAIRANTNQYIRIDDNGATGDTTFYLRKLKLEAGNNPNPTFSAGRNKKKILTGLGKRAGSMTENPIRIYYKYASTFDAPSTFTQEIDQAGYDSLSKQDGVLYSRTTSTAGQYAQMLIEYDPNSNMSLKEFKAMLRNLTASATLYGQGDNAGVLANGATTKWWVNSTSTWTGGTGSYNNTSSSPSTITVTDAGAGNVNYITKDQKIYILVHSTYPASASNASSLFVDYCNLTVSLSDQVDFVKSNILKVNPQTKEIKTMFPAISYRSIGNGGGVDRVSLYYRYVPWQGDNTLVPDAIVKRPDWMYITSEASGKAETFSGVNYDKYKNVINKLFGSLYSGGDYTGQRLSTSVPQANESVTPSIMRVPLSTGLEGTTSSFKDAKTALLDSGSVAYLVTDPTLISSGKFVNFVPFLVLKNSEVYLAIKHRTSSLVAEAGQVGSQAVLFRIDGRPLAKGL